MDIVIRLLRRHFHNRRWEDKGTLLRMNEKNALFLIEQKAAVKYSGDGNTVARSAPPTFQRARGCCGG